jgi:hypothetical protein
MPTATKYTHEQPIASNTWNILHNLDTLRPLVDCWIVVEGVDTKILPLEVTVVDSMNATVTFSAPRAGGAAVR